MGLFTSLVFNNGTAHTFVEQGQFAQDKGILRRYIEPAAPGEIQSLLTIKHDLSSKTIQRGLAQRTCMIMGTDGKYYPYTANFTSIFNKLCAESAVVLEQKLLAAAIADASFHANFVKGLS